MCSRVRVRFRPAALLLRLLAVVEERGLVEGDAAAGGARGEEALRLLVVRAGHGQALRLVHPDGDFCGEGSGRRRLIFLFFIFPPV